MTHSSFEKTNHRPWPISKGVWTWRQSWHDLLFAHWKVPADLLRPFVPAPLTLQEENGLSWMALVPFRMEGVMRRPFPDLPGISAFPELNVRIYVEHQGKPGVWFLSLDAANRLAVWAARRFFHLPYFYAKMQMTEDSSGFSYRSHRPDQSASLICSYRPISAVYEAKSGNLDHWLTERYCLYAKSPRGDLYRAEIHHWPWPLQLAEAEFQENTLFQSHGIKISGPPDLLHFAKRIDVVVWGIKKVE